MQLDTTSPVGKFYLLLRELSISLGTAVREETEYLNEATSENIVGNIELSNTDGAAVKIRLELEKLASGSAVRASLFFGFNTEEQEWSQQPSFLKALMLCRVTSGNCLPMAPALFPEGEILWQMLLPLDDKALKSLGSFIKSGSSFYQAAFTGIRDLGFEDQLTSELKNKDRALGVLWTIRTWSQQKKLYEGSIEDFSLTGHYYRLLPPTIEQSGMVAINLGSVSDFIGIHRILPTLLKTNAITFLNENYYIGFDDRGSLLMIAFLSPLNEMEKKQRLDALLKRAEEVRAFILKITSELEAAAIQDTFKNMTGITELVLT